MKDFVIQDNCLLIKFSLDTKGPSGKLTGIVPVRGIYIEINVLRKKIFSKFIDGQFTANGITHEDIVIEAILTSPIYEKGGGL